MSHRYLLSLAAAPYEGAVIVLDLYRGIDPNNDYVLVTAGAGRLNEDGQGAVFETIRDRELVPIADLTHATLVMLETRPPRRAARELLDRLNAKR